MGKKDERIRELEAKVAELEGRIAALEARPWYVPYTEPVKRYPCWHGPITVDKDSTGYCPPPSDNHVTCDDNMPMTEGVAASGSTYRATGDEQWSWT